MLSMVAALILILAATLQDQRKAFTSIDEMEMPISLTDKGISSNSLILSIEKNGRFMIGQEIILINADESSSNLGQRIAEWVSASDRVLLSADQQTPHGLVVRVELALEDTKIPYSRIVPNRE